MIGKAATTRRLTHAVRDLLLAYKATLEEAVRPHGLTLPQLRMLHAVSEQNEVSAATIARLCHVTPQTLQAMLTRAVREGWIVRGTTQRNHRILTVSLTPEGENLLAIGQKAAIEIEDRMWSGVPRKALEETIEILERGTAGVGAPRTEQC
ncbi:DNA-binding transcriptional regulator, MarR family [Bryocella elongata]|uniref:DNA-binding transcriptional regulator, MarR family n=1 Tax=Bryocella elongata TaxID=863522 RepID=A0A1H6ANY0_9BACT|nr:DNA-binding transcriptional regulator, MarR family [Bryocella elongata]